MLSSVEVIDIFFTQVYKISRKTFAEFLVVLKSFSALQFDTNTCIFILLSWCFWEEADQSKQQL